MPRRTDLRRKGESLGDYLERLQVERAAAKKESVNHIFGQWLEDISAEWPWDWFCTFTFSDPKVTAFGAHHFVRSFIERMGRENGAFAKPYAFRADEYGPEGGRFHIHALIGNVCHLTHFCEERLLPGQFGRKCCWMHRWPCGIARIKLYQKDKGANFYVTKYVTKALGDFELIGFEVNSLRFRKLTEELAR